MLIVLSFDKNEAYAENNCNLPLTLGGAVPDSARDTPTTRRPTRLTPSSPLLSQTGASGRSVVGIPTSASSVALFLPSSQISPRPTEPSRTFFPSSPTQLVIRTRTFLSPAAMIHKHD